MIALGVFDGVHAGHRAVLTTAAAMAQQQQAAAVALTFMPHPRQVLTPDSAPALLISPARRLELLAAVPGIGGCGQINFSTQIAAWEPEEFFRRLLQLPQLKVKGMCGQKLAFRTARQRQHPAAGVTVPSMRYRFCGGAGSEV